MAYAEQYCTIVFSERLFREITSFQNTLMQNYGKNLNIHETVNLILRLGFSKVDEKFIDENLNFAKKFFEDKRLLLEEICSSVLMSAQSEYPSE